MLVSIDQLNQSKKRYDSYEDVFIRSKIKNIEDELLSEIIEEDVSPEIAKGNIIGDKKNLEKRFEMLKKIAHEPTEFAYERAIGNNDSVYSNFVELLLETKKKVGRIVKKDGFKPIGHATGFMITRDLMMTNWHVFKTMDEVNSSVLEFNYEYNSNGEPMTPVVFDLDPNSFFYSFKPLDYCVIAVRSIDKGGKVPLSSFGCIDLNPALGKLGNEKEELLNIIHHPGGDYKQLSIRENQFEKIMPTTLWYKSDTAQGSSGSPVFNDQWQVVALHHMGVAKKNEKGEYLDKDNLVIPIIKDKIDISRIHWIANEGIRISVIVKDLFSKFPDSDYVNKISSTEKEVESFQDISVHQNKSNNQNIIESMENNNQNVNVSFPSSLITHKGNIKIEFSVNDGLGQRKEVIPLKHDYSDSLDELLLESKKLEKEMDYSLCRGYQSNFLGNDFDVLIPKPQDDIKQFITKIKGTDSIVLNYYKFSVIYHSQRKMPLLSAINIDGDINKRQDKTKRKDKWIRDNRIDFFVQLNYEDFYYKSGFDRGHMSRREDANWGETPQEAKRNADLTCVYTNSCPQVPTLNRSRSNGLWGKLEKVVLEKGAIKEGEGKNKITVFSGPIFKDDEDPIFKGVLIPTNYYKVILWIDDENKLKATAFVLTQEELLGNIDLEAVDLDKNIEFKEYQRSLKWLHKNTKIDFSHLFSFDTFKGKDDDFLEISEDII